MKKSFDYKIWWQKNRSVLGAVILASFISLLCWLIQDESPTSVLDDTPEFIDTYIPQGFTIVPIEIVNHSSLSSIISNHGVIDLYATSFEKDLQPSKKIASRVKIIRAPLNPNQFAIIVPEAEVSTILSYKNPYYATIHNSKLQEPLSVNKKRSSKNRIFVDHIED